MHCILKKELPWFLETSAYIIDHFIEELVHILNLDHFLQMEPLCGENEWTTRILLLLIENVKKVQALCDS